MAWLVNLNLSCVFFFLFVFTLQSYFKLVRPGDGRFKMSHLPHTTHYGKPFDPRNSLV